MKLEIVYPERSPIDAVKAYGCGLPGTIVVAAHHGHRIMLHAADGDQQVLAEFTRDEAAKFFNACLAMTGPAIYQEGEAQP